MMNQPDSDLTDGRINIREVIFMITSKWYYFLITLAVLIPAACAYIYFADNRYLIRASILLNEEVKNGLNSEKFLKGMELMTTHTELEDEIGILKSYNLSESTIKRLDFGISYYSKSNFRSLEQYGDEFLFRIKLDSTVNQLVGVPIYIKRLPDSLFSISAEAKTADTYNFYTSKNGEMLSGVYINSSSSNTKPFISKHLAFTIKFNQDYAIDPDAEYYFVIHTIHSLSDSYSNAIEIKPISRESSLVEVSIKVGNPEKGILFLNTLLDVYRANELNKKNQLGLKTIRFIDEQLSGVSTELGQVESSLESFRSRNNILDISTTAENLNKNLESLETDKSLLEQRLKYYKYIATSLDKDNLKGIGAPSTFGFEDPLLNGMLIELARLNQERTGLNYSTKEANPVAEVLELKIASARMALIDNVNNFIEASSQALADLRSRISFVRANVQGLPKSERELVNIQRKFDFNDNVYNYLLEKRAEAGIAIASNTVEKTIVDRARQIGDGPIAPSKKLILLLTFLFGLIFSVGLIIFKDVLDDTIVTLKDVEKNTPIPTIGTISHASKAERSSVIVAVGKSACGESFRSLRVNLQYLTLGNENNVIGVTSAVESEGKTFCSINLAAAMAQAGKRTIIIDADMRRPKIATSFRLRNEIGLSNFLIGSSPLKEIIRSTTMKGLDVITSGPIPPNPLDLIGLPKMLELITALKQTYSTIIIDSPPIGFVSEYIILKKYTNANIYVVRANHTKRFHFDRINRLYNDQKIKNVSVLLNDATSAAGGYNYVYK